MRPPASALIACLALLLVAPPTVIAQDGGNGQRPRNALTLPVQEPTAVEIYVSQTQLYALRRDKGGAFGMALGGAIGGAIGGAVSAYTHGKNRERQADPRDGFLTQLNASIPATDYRNVLTSAVRKHMDATRFARITSVEFHSAAPAETEAARPGNPDEQVLAVDVRYYFAPGYTTLRIAMYARLGPRRIVTAPPSKANFPSFVQELYWDLPADQGDAIIVNRDRNALYWTTMGGPAVGAGIATGMDEAMAMLAAELDTQPRFGRLTGKPVAWQELQNNSTYGVVEQQVGGRDWVRLRNGRLASVPTRTP